MRARAGAAARRIFPGSRWVWYGGLAVLLVGLVLLVRFLGAQTFPLTGTNSVGVGAIIAKATSGEEACVRDLLVPEDTGRVEVWAAALEVQPGARIDAYIRSPQGRVPLRAPPALPGADYIPFSLDAPLEEDLEDAEVCFVPRDLVLDFGGANVQRLPGAPVTKVAGLELPGTDISVRYLRAIGDEQRVIDALDEALTRATVFDPGLAALLIWLVLPALLALIYVALRVMATADRYSVRRLAVLAAAVTFVHAGAWALLLHPFHGADESEHFAYAQHVVATGERAEAEKTSQKPPYSSAQVRLLGALRHNSTILNPSSRPRWDDRWADEFRAAAKGVTDEDGGGYTESGTGHSPLYYALVGGLPLRIWSAPEDQPTALMAMRLLNALLAAAIAALAVLTAAAVFPGRRQVAWFAGLLVGLQPVFGSVAGAFNNDTAVNLAAAGLVFTLVHAWRSGLTRRTAVALGLLVLTVPVVKVTGFGVLPVVAVGAVVLALRWGLGPLARWGLVAGGTAAVATVVWVFALAPLLGGDRGKIFNSHPNTEVAVEQQPGAPPVPPPAPPITLTTRAEYIFQTYVPWPTVGTDRWMIPAATKLERWPAYRIYIERGYGLWGWKSNGLSRDMLRGIFGGLVVGWLLAVAAVWRHRRRWREWAGPAALLVGAAGSVLCFVAAAYSINGVRTEPGEQGRYAFTAIVPLAVLFSAGLFALRGRWRELLAGAGAAATSLLALLVWLHALRGWFM